MPHTAPSAWAVLCGNPKMLYSRDQRCIEKGRGGGGWHKASVSDCLPLAAPTGLSPLLILTLCGSERVLVVSTEPPDDLSCLTTPGVGRPGDGLLPVPLTGCIQRHIPSPCGGLPTGEGGSTALPCRCKPCCSVPPPNCSPPTAFANDSDPFSRSLQPPPSPPPPPCPGPSSTSHEPLALSGCASAGASVWPEALRAGGRAVEAGAA